MIKKLLALSAIAAFTTGAVAAPQFTVQESAITDALANEVTADKLTLRYEAGIDQSADGTFTETGYFTVTALALGNSPAGSQLNLSEGLLGGVGYQMYGLFSVSGTISFVGTTALATFTDGSFSLFSDPNQDTDQSIVGFLPVIGGLTADDQPLATASGILGGSQANVPLIGDQAASGGSFVINYDNFTLVGAGVSYFFEPSPFYLQIEVSGENESFNPALVEGDYQGVATGDASAIFAQVPEPGTVALAGLALLIMGASTIRRRR